MAQEPLLNINPIYTARGQLPSDGHTAWWNILEDYEKGRLKIPTHQREPGVWGKRKRAEFVRRLRDTVTGQQERPLGVIAQYLLHDGDLSFYLNDGWQRLHTLHGAKQNPEMYGMSNEEMEMVLKHPKTQVAIQYRTYPNHQEAARDFQRINDGTGLRPAEKNKGCLVYSPRWIGFGEFIISKWSTRIQHALASFCSQPKDNRGEMQRMTLFFFILAHKKEPFFWTGRDTLEKEAASWLIQTDQGQCDRHICRIEAIFAQIEKCWREQHPEPGCVMVSALAKWIAFVRLANDEECTEKWFSNFINKLLIETQGKPYFTNLNKTLARRIDLFSAVCKELGIDQPARHERERPKMPAKSGFHLHHIKPHVDYGEGKTKPIPALENASLNAREIKI